MCNLARVTGEVGVEVDGAVTLGGTLRDYATRKRRPLVRFYACGEDDSNEPPEARLPDEIASGKAPLLIIGAIAGG